MSVLSSCLNSFVYRIGSGLLVAGLCALALTSCTSKKPTASVRFTFPVATSGYSKVESLATSQATSVWGVPDPTSLGQISCYAILVGGEAMRGKTCTSLDGMTVAQVGMIAGGFPAGSSIALDVPAGLREFYVVGFASASASACQDFRATNGPQKSLLSAPHILGRAQKELVGGAANDVVINASLTGAVKFESCTGEMEPMVPANPYISFTSPAPDKHIGSAQISSFAATGTCINESQPVELTAANGVVSVSASPVCTSNAWTASVSLSGMVDGPITLSAVHASTTVSLNVTKDTVAPGAFTITGMTGTTDAIADAFLGNLLPIVRWSASSGMDGYGIKIMDAAGTTEVCAVRPALAAATSFSYELCPLTNGTAYKAVVFAKDLAGNITNASNSPYAFTVDTSGPTAPASFSAVSSYYSLSASPLFTWGASSDTVSGLKHYEISVGTNPDAADVLGWTIVPVLSYQKTSGLALTAGNTYTASLRAIDNAGNSSMIVRTSWIAQPPPFGNSVLPVKSIGSFSSVGPMDTALVGRTLAASRRIHDVDGATRKILTLGSAFTTSDFSPGDEVVWHVFHDSAGGCGGVVAPGQYEFARVVAVNAGALAVTLDKELGTVPLDPVKLSAAPVIGNPACVIQLVRVPHFTDLTIDSGSQLFATMNNYVNGGGLLALRVDGTLTVNGLLHADWTGYSGGGYNIGSSSGGQGDSYVSLGSTVNSAANGNAGGGSGTTGGGAGGGGGARPGGSGASNGGSGIGGGGAPTCTGSCALGNVFLGGGGGGAYDTAGVGGGSGGGVLIVYARNLAGTGVISAKGQPSQGACATSKGAGGGGGGMIVLQVKNDTFTGAVRVNGGNGGSCGAGYGGGGGGGGAIHQLTCSSIPARAVEVNPGSGGPGTVSGSPGFPGLLSTVTTFPMMCNTP
ncbi:MAG: hypothetical protein NDI61_10735 [Bdellovibrionaceae bacterium]|nr:hypothetical protein [Pseudobdellovibrionaceae bacterium]